MHFHAAGNHRISAALVLVLTVIALGLVAIAEAAAA
jgi:hypothetical protein